MCLRPKELSVCCWARRLAWSAGPRPALSAGLNDWVPVQLESNAGSGACVGCRCLRLLGINLRGHLWVCSCRSEF